MSRSYARFAVFCVVALAAGAASACPSCKEALASADPERVALVRGYFWSILFMISMPFTLLAAWGIYIYRLVRQSRRTAMTAAVASAAPHEKSELVDSQP